MDNNEIKDMYKLKLHWKGTPTNRIPSKVIRILRRYSNTLENNTQSNSNIYDVFRPLYESDSNEILVWEFERGEELQRRKSLIESIINESNLQNKKNIYPTISSNEKIKLRKKLKDIYIAKKMVWLEDRAREKGLTFDMSFGHTRNLLIRKTCYYTGELLNDIIDDPNQRTIDQIIPGEGYVDENTVATIKRINGGKGNLFPKDIILIARAMEKKKLLKISNKKHKR